MASVLSGGLVSAVYSYTPWGEASGAGELPFLGYRSQEHAGGGTGLQYLRARFYDAASAAFPSADSYLGDPSDPSSLNRYAYCGGNPVAFSDPSGNERFSSQKQRNSWLKNNSAKGKQQKARTALARSYRKNPLSIGAAALSLSVAKLPLVGKVAASGVASARASGSKARQTWRTEMPAAVSLGERGAVTANASYHKVSLARPVPVVSYAQWQSQQVREKYCSRSMRFMGAQVPEPVKAVVQGLHDIFAITGPTPIGVVTDPVDALLYFAQGEDLLGAVALVGTIPIGGDLLQGGVKLARHGDDIADAMGDAADLVSDVTHAAGKKGDAALDSALTAERAVDPVDGYIYGEEADSSILRDALKAAGIKPPKYANAAHHIVAGNDSRAADARKLLEKYHIGINSASNGVFLPYKDAELLASYHPSVHTDFYYTDVTRRLYEAEKRGKNSNDKRGSIVAELESIRQDLQNGVYKGKSK